MKISIAQTNPKKGDIEGNLKDHILYIERAVENHADMIVFPELSLTGYEPQLAKSLATTKTDKRLDTLQKLSDKNKIIIGVGLPIVESDNIFVSMVIFQPCKERIVYSKQYLYHTEVGTFTAAHNPLVLHFDDDNIIAPAICFELSNAGHQENAHKMGANIYIASVLNSFNGINADIEKLSSIAAKYKMTTFMANYTGISGGHECAGQSSIWNDNGELLARFDEETTGLLIYNTQTKDITIEPIQL